MAHAIKGAITSQIRRFLCSYKTPQIQDFKFTPDLLFSNLKSANSTRNVLDLVAQHNDIMNNKHIMQALRSLFILQKNGNSEMSTSDILSHKDFKKLCRKLRSQASGIELSEIIEALKIVSYVGVSSESTIFQVLLQLIRHNVNNLNLHQTIFLDFLLTQTTRSPLVDALKIALPIIFEIHLPKKLDRSNESHLAECLYFASRHSLNVDSVEIIVNALMDCPEFDVKTAKSIIWSICDMEANDLFALLMKKAIDCLVVHFDELTFNEMETTLSKLISRVSRKSSYFYDETYYNSCANYVIDKDLGYKHSIYVLRKFGRVNFFHKFLLDYMSRKVHENPELLTNADASDIYSIVIATAMTDYRPTYWETVKNLIAKSGNLASSERREIIWIKFAASLCLLDIFKLDVLSKCLNENFLKQLFNKRKFMSDFENYCTIWHCIMLFKPELSCLLSAEFDPKNLSRSYKQELEFPLEPALHKAFGGETYVKTDLYSKYGIQIDHAVVFRRGQYPVAMNFPKELQFIEDIQVPPENQLVAILGLRHFNYTLNNKILRCSTSVAIKFLETQGIQAVPVCLETWMELPDFEKIPYIMTLISDLKISQNVVQ